MNTWYRPRYRRGRKARVRFSTREMVTAMEQAISVIRPNYDQMIRSFLAELNVFFGTPLQLNAVGQLEVTPQQHALMMRCLPVAERDAWATSMALEDIPLLVVEPPC